MKIAQVHPGCGIPVPPPDWGAIEKIVWEFHCNSINLGHESYIKFINEIHPGQYDIVHCHVANLALDLAKRGIPYIYQLHDHHAYHYGKESHVYKENLKAIDEVQIFDTDQELIDIIATCDVMVKGSDYIGKPIVGEHVCKQIIFFDRINGYSTTKKIQSITNR